MDCWDNPTTANADCIYLERDLTHRPDRYNRGDDITAVNFWSENLGNGNYLIYIEYASGRKNFATDLQGCVIGICVSIGDYQSREE